MLPPLSIALFLENTLFVIRIECKKEALTAPPEYPLFDTKRLPVMDMLTALTEAIAPLQDLETEYDDSAVLLANNVSWIYKFEELEYIAPAH